MVFMSKLNMHFMLTVNFKVFCISKVSRINKYIFYDEHTYSIMSNKKACYYRIWVYTRMHQLQFSSYRYIGLLATGANHLGRVEVTASNY